MICKLNFNYALILLENNFFLKKKKNLKFIKKLSLYTRTRRVSKNDNFDMQINYWYFFVRLESLFGSLPTINNLKFLKRKKPKKTKKNKKSIAVKSSVSFSIFSFNEKKINFILDYVLNLNNYFYVKFLLNKKYKIKKFEQFSNQFAQKNVFVQKNSVLFENNLYFRWLDLSRNFIDILNYHKSQFYKGSFKRWNKSRRLKFYFSKIVIHSEYYKFFVSPIKILAKNHKKLMLFLFKKFRKRRKNEKAYILL